MAQTIAVRNVWSYYLVPVIKLLDTHERWRKVAKILQLSKAARRRLDWIIYYREHGANVRVCYRHFGIAPKTFYKWYRLFNEDNLYSLRQLEDQSRAPRHVRQREITPEQEQRITALRQKHLRWGKQKLARIYQTTYGETISSWKIQKVIEARQLYYHPKKSARLAQKRLQARSHKKKRLTELKDLKWYQKKAGYIICLDTITLYGHNLKRYIFTAIDRYGKVAFARMYKNKSSQSAKDFLERLYFLLDGKVPRVGHDNGSEFKLLFQKACQTLEIEQYWSRVHTPKDNAANERFNRTLQEEFLAFGHFHPDPAVFNRRLTEWLVEYNFVRPHESLKYQTPVERSKVLPMYSSCTWR